MLRTGWILDPRYELHTTPPGHPECPERIRVLRELAREYQREGVVRLDPRPATIDEIALNHDRDYIRIVAATAERQFYDFDADTSVCSRSYEIALLAAGGFLEILDRIMAGDLDNGFAMVRPPGHHAEREQAMGFCLFNNVAVGARYLRQKHGLERILIMDWDVHHGNGTQNSFYDDPSVLYISTHQYPYYPGSGSAHETGRGKGEGFNINIPLPAGCGNDVYLKAFYSIIEPIAKQFDPQFVLISAGFDCHYRDPLGGMMVNEEGIGEMTRSLLRLSRDHAGGKCGVILEGGYDLEALKHCSAVVLEELGGEHMSHKIPAGEDPLGVLEGPLAIHRNHWKL